MKNKFFKKGLVALCVAALICTFASCGEKKENSSEAASEATSVESSVDTSATSEDASEATSEEATSEDASAETSEEASAEVSEEVSEEVSVEIPEEFKDNKGINAVVEMENMEKGKVILSGKIELDANIISELLGDELASLVDLNASGYMECKGEMYIDNTGEEKREFIKAATTLYITAGGKEIINNTSVEERLIIGDVNYVFDHDAKTYTTDEAVNMIDLDDIKSVETKEEVYEGTTYIVDTITFSDDSTVDIYTVDGEIAYFGTDILDSLENASIKLAVEMDHDNSGVSFEIPEGYTAA